MKTLETVALSFLAGAIVNASAVYLAQGNSALPMFIAGALCPTLILAAALSSRTRQRRAAELLMVLANPAEPRRRLANAILKAEGFAPPAAVAAPLIEELTDAYRKLGGKRAEAKAAARRALQIKPDATFEQAMRIMIQARQPQASSRPN
jgi:hypothetical protein